MVTMVKAAIKEPQRILEIVMEKHFGILDFFFSYIVSGLILVIVFAVLLKVGATEESIGRFTEDHKSIPNE